MRKIILTKGLPGSGKTTWAKQYQKDNPNTVLVNKDDLRGMLHQNVWSKGREAFILEIRNAIIIRALEEGHDVIVHDTNLHPKHHMQMVEITKLPQFAGKVQVEIKDFTDVPLEVCIKRDLKRYSSVGEKVIKDMYRDFLAPAHAIVLHDPALPDAIICDLDGTLALFGNANPYDRDFTKDEVNEVVREILRLHVGDETKIIFVSGRKDIYRDQTEAWLKEKWGFDYLLFMRKTAPAGQPEPKDVLVKQDIYEENIKGKYNVLFVLDDRNQVVEFWRAAGLICLQVAPGDF